jgi:hypothetical protein
MPQKQIYFDHKINSSVQLGDTVYYAQADSYGVLGEPEVAGKIVGLPNNGAMIINANTGVTIPSSSFILFSKPIQINESSVKGYYADITLENHSNKRAELFALSSEIVPSSK